jgi:tetratricopeptide (TPR) repeat protein
MMANAATAIGVGCLAIGFSVGAYVFHRPMPTLAENDIAFPIPNSARKRLAIPRVFGSAIVRGAVMVLATLAITGSTARSAITSNLILRAGDRDICESPDLPPDTVISYCAALIRLDIDDINPVDRWRYPRKVPFAHYALNTGFAYLRKGDGESAGKYFAFAIWTISEKLKPFPNAAELLAERCWTRAVIGQQLEEALKDCDQGALAQPEDSELLRNKGFVLMRMGKYQDALIILEK